MLEYSPAVDIKQLVMSDQPMPLLPKRIRKALKDNIAEKDIILPLVVERKKNGILEIIDGRNRWEIANELGKKYVPCLIGDEDNPLVRTLKYDLELCRRMLNDDEYEKFSKQREKFIKDLIRNAKQEYLEKVIPEFRDIIATIYGDDIKGLIQFAKLPADKQQAIVEDKSKFINSKIEKELQEKKDEVERLLSDLKSKEEIEKQYNLLLSTTQTQIEKRLADKEKELEKKFKGNAPEDIKRLIAEERKKIEAEYKSELEDFHNRLIEISQAKDKVSGELKQMKEQLKQTENNFSTAQKLVEKYRKETETMQAAITQLTAPDALMNQLDAVYADIQSMSAKAEALCKELMKTYKGLSNVAKSLNGQSVHFIEKVGLISESICNIKVNEARSIASEMGKFLSKL